MGVDALKPQGFFIFNQMKKTFYFSHDFEPTSDPKIQALISEYGGLGYGIWWRIIEMLHSDDDHKLPKKQFLFRAIAGQMKCEYILIEEFIEIQRLLNHLLEYKKPQDEIVVLVDLSKNEPTSELLGYL